VFLGGVSHDPAGGEANWRERVEHKTGNRLTRLSFHIFTLSAVRGGEYSLLPRCPRTLWLRAPDARPSAYDTGAFLLKRILVLRDAFEKRVCPCLCLHIILDFFSCFGNLQQHKICSRPLFLLRICDLTSPRKMDFWAG
jgi:hypothetical protein